MYKRITGGTYLDPGLGEVYLHGDLLPGVDVRVVSLLEGSLQLLQLSRGESGPDPPLLPLLCQDPVLARVHLVRQPWQGEQLAVTTVDLYSSSDVIQ